MSVQRSIKRNMSKLLLGSMAVSSVASVGSISANALGEENLLSFSEETQIQRTVSQTPGKMAEAKDGSVYVIGDGTTDSLMKMKDNKVVWEKSFAGANLFDVKTTEDGGVVGLINFSSEADPLFAGMKLQNWTASNYDIAIVKWDKDGNVVWKQSYGGKESDTGYSLTLTKDGGYLISGSTVSYEIVERGETIPNGSYRQSGDAFVMKVDKDGHREWFKVLTGSYADMFVSAIQTKDGNFVAVGSAGSSSNGYANIPGLQSAGGIMFKFDKDGNVLWKTGLTQLNYGNTNFTNIQETPSGELILTGSRGYTYTPGGYLALYSSDGEKKWDKTLSSGTPLYVYSTSITKEGNIVLTGRVNQPRYATTGVFEGFKFPATNSDVSFLLTHDMNGNQLDVKVFRYALFNVAGLAKADGSMLLAGKQYYVNNGNAISFFQYGEAVSVDKEAPELTLQKDNENPTNKTVTIQVTATDEEGGSGVKAITLPNGNVVQGDSTEFTVNENGEYIFEVEDNAGNIETKTISISNIDKINPTEPTFTVTPNTISLVAGTDIGSGVKEVQYSINGSEFGSYTETLSLADGQYDVKAKTIDLAGNESDVVSLSVTMYGEQLEKAEQVIEQAKLETTQEAVDSAVVEVSALPDNAVEKETLSEEVLSIQKNITTEAVQEVTTIPTVENYENAFVSINSLNTIANELPVSIESLEATKASISTLTAEVVSVEDNLIVDNNSASGKAIGDAVKFVNKAEATPNKGLIQVAQKKIDALEDGVVKSNLQKRLDALN
jgi:hypothetical protein